MQEKLPTTHVVKASAARQRWSELLKSVFRREARIIVEKSGIPVAAIISADDLERLRQMEAAREARWRVVDELHARNRDRNPEEVEQDVAEALADVRAEQRTLGAGTAPNM